METASIRDLQLNLQCSLVQAKGVAYFAPFLKWHRAPRGYSNGQTITMLLRQYVILIALQ